jgi:hypothetical protein
MEDRMAPKQKKAEPGQPDIVDELRRRDQPVPDAPATVPHPGEEVAPGGSQPSEDGGVDQHPIHDSDVEDLGPEDYEEMTDEAAKTGAVRKP